MSYEKMASFLSFENVLGHEAYLKDLRLRYSILEKSLSFPLPKSLNDLLRERIPREIYDEALMLLSEISLHEVYFDSFSIEPASSNPVKAQFGSREAFLYELFSFAKDKKVGFLLIYLGARGKIHFDIPSSITEITRYKPILAIDLYEHAYFSDYGFRRNDYLRAALSNIDLSKLQ